MINKKVSLLESLIKRIVMEEKKLHEAKTAWSGRFENLDKILSQNYNQMKPADQNIKDTLFHAYYRYYNDGDVNAFPMGMLKKIGAPEEVTSAFALDKYGERPSSGVKRDQRVYRGNEKSTRMKNWETAMEGAILATFKYFKSKYPTFFNAEGRQKTIQQWKSEVLKSAQSKPTELDTYWVGEFGKQFGKPELAQYGKRRYSEKLYSITDPDEIADIIRTMLKSVKQGA